MSAMRRPPHDGQMPRPSHAVRHPRHARRPGHDAADRRAPAAQPRRRDGRRGARRARAAAQRRYRAPGRLLLRDELPALGAPLVRAAVAEAQDEALLCLRDTGAINDKTYVALQLELDRGAHAGRQAAEGAACDAARRAPPAAMRAGRTALGLTSRIEIVGESALAFDPATLTRTVLLDSRGGSPSRSGGRRALGVESGRRFSA